MVNYTMDRQIVFFLGGGSFSFSHVTIEFNDVTRYPRMQLEVPLTVSHTKHNLTWKVLVIVEDTLS